MSDSSAFRCVFLTVTALVLLSPGPTTAAWPGDPFVNLSVCGELDQQSSPVIVSDGAGGAIVAWLDYRASGYPTSPNIYAQRISAEGMATWDSDGLAVCTDATGQDQVAIASDGAGGALVTWLDYRNGATDIFAQRISGEGAVQWTANGVPVCTAVNSQAAPFIVTDDAGGAIITWIDQRIGGWGSIDIYAQRVSDAGVMLWAVDGVALCTAPQNQEEPAIAPDGAGGAIITWQDARSGEYDIYAQRIDDTGELGGTVQAIYLTQFDVRRQGGQATIRWTISLPRDHAGFHVWRQMAGSDRLRLTREMLSGQEVYDFVDPTPPIGPTDYWLQEVTTDGSGIWYGPAHLEAATVPLALRLEQNQPNPFNPRTTFSFSLPKPGRVLLVILDLRGTRLATVVDSDLPAGEHRVQWNGLDSHGLAAPSGVYFARLETAAGMRAMKMTLAR